MNDAGRAEDRQPADDAEPRVPGLLRELLAAGNGNFDLDAAVPPSSAITALIIWRGTGLIAGSPGRNRQARLGDRSDSLLPP